MDKGEIEMMKEMERLKDSTEEMMEKQEKNFVAVEWRLFVLLLAIIGSTLLGSIGG